MSAARLHDLAGTRRSSAKASRGQSVIEVMVAISLLAIASTGVFALQKVAITGNSRAKDLAVASQVGRTWLERLRADASGWNYPAPSHPSVQCSGGTAGCIGSTTWLKGVSTPNVWFKPANVSGRGGAGFDALGNDVADTLIGTATYCAHVRLAWMYPNELIRAEVRVFWLKQGGDGPLGGTFCAEADPAVLGSAANDPLGRYHFAYFATSVPVNPAP